MFGICHLAIAVAWQQGKAEKGIGDKITTEWWPKGVPNVGVPATSCVDLLLSSSKEAHCTRRLWRTWGRQGCSAAAFAVAACLLRDPLPRSYKKNAIKSKIAANEIR